MSQLGHEQPVRSGSVITTPRRCAGRGGHQNRHCETRAAVWSRFRQLRSSQQEALPMPASGHNRPTCSSLVCLLPPGADMVRKRAPEEPSGWTPAPASAYGPACDFEPHPSHLPVPDRGVRYPLGPPGRIFNQSLYMLVRDEISGSWRRLREHILPAGQHRRTLARTPPWHPDRDQGRRRSNSGPAPVA
jgi:hypothetical protein